MNLDPRDPSNLPITFGILNDRKGPSFEPSGCGCAAALAALVLLGFVLALLRAGKTMDAIKRYREPTGVDFAHAREALEGLA